MATTQNKPPASSETLKPDYASLSKDIAWIQRIGSAIAGGFAAVFIGLITWYLPREFENSRQILKGTVTEQLNPITQDIAALKGQVASISGIIPQLMKEKLQAHGSSVKESLQTVAEIAKSARAKKIETDPKAIGEIGVKVLEIGERNPPDGPYCVAGTL